MPAAESAQANPAAEAMAKAASANDICLLAIKMFFQIEKEPERGTSAAKLLHGTLAAIAGRRKQELLASVRRPGSEQIP